MQRYNYTARDQTGKIIRGKIMAEDDVDLAHKISSLGYFLTNFKIVSEDRNATQGKIKTKGLKMKPRELLQFTYQISTLIDAGLPLLNGLNELVNQSSNETVRGILSDVRYRIESGGSLKNALAAYPKTFTPIYQAVIGAGEAAGKLPQALTDLAYLLEWQQDLKAKIKEAAMYPIILFVVLTFVVAILVVKVIPIFEPMFEAQGQDLPLPTQIVLNVSSFVRSFWYLMIGSGGLLFGVYKAYYSTENGRYIIDSIKLKMPIVGDLIRKTVLSRFSHIFALSFKSGINLLTCLDTAKDACANERIERAIEKVRNSVNVGERLADSLKASNEFPNMVVSIISAGEQSGALAETLNKVASFYDKEVEVTTKRIFVLMEPIMIVIMGIVVGGIAVAIFLPMFQMGDMIGG